MAKGQTLFKFLSRMRWQVKVMLLFILILFTVRLGWIAKDAVTSWETLGEITSSIYVDKMTSSRLVDKMTSSHISKSENLYISGDDTRDHNRHLPVLFESPVINMTLPEENVVKTPVIDMTLPGENVVKTAVTSSPRIVVTSSDERNTTTSQKTGVNPSLETTAGPGGGNNCTNTWRVGPRGEPVSKIVFLKTHKAASSTVQNIFLRYALQRNLTLALGFQELASAQLGWPNEFRKDFAYPSTKGTYDMICHHMRYSDDVAMVMPNNSVYITVIRDPIQVFQSYFAYYQLDRQFKLDQDADPLATFSKNPRKYEVVWDKASPVRNVMMFDLGLKKEEMGDEKLIQEKIKKIEKRFDIVLMAEYFDESLILMRDFLNWGNRDILYFKQNIMKDSKKQIMSSQTKRNLERWNKADMMLYRHFNATFWSNVNKYCPEKLKAEVIAFRSQLAQWRADCVLDVVTGNQMFDPLYKTYNPQALSYRLKAGAHGNETCVNLAKTEIPFTKEITRRMRETKALNFNVNYSITIKKGSPEEKALLKQLAALKG